MRYLTVTYGAIMPSSHLTAAAVERIKPPKTGQVDHFDKGFPGLALRVSYGGAKSWVYFFRLHGRLHRLTLGRSPALSLAITAQLLALAASIIDIKASDLICLDDANDPYP